MRKFFNFVFVSIVLFITTACSLNLRMGEIQSIQFSFNGRPASESAETKNGDYDLTVWIEENGKVKDKKITKFSMEKANETIVFDRLKVNSKIIIRASLCKNGVEEYIGSKNFVIGNGVNNVKINLFTPAKIKFFSDSASPSVEKPIIVNISDGTDSRNIEITEFPTTVAVEPGNYSVSMKDFKNKEETVIFSPISQPVVSGDCIECSFRAEPNKVYYVAENATTGGKGTKASPFSKVTETINKIENGSGFSFNKGSDDHSFVINVSGNIKEKEQIYIKKGYEVTIQGTAETPATITAIADSGAPSGDVTHCVMEITENQGVGIDDSFQNQTRVNLKHIKITGGITTDEGAGINLIDGILCLGDGAVITGNNKKTAETPSTSVGVGILVNAKSTAYGGRKIFTKVILEGNAKVGENDNDNAIVIQKSDKTVGGFLVYKDKQIQLGTNFTGSANVNVMGFDIHNDYDAIFVEGDLTKVNKLKNTERLLFTKDGKLTDCMVM